MPVYQPKSLVPDGVASISQAFAPVGHIIQLFNQIHGLLHLSIALLHLGLQILGLLLPSLELPAGIRLLLVRRPRHIVDLISVCLLLLAEDIFFVFNQVKVKVLVARPGGQRDRISFFVHLRFQLLLFQHPVEVWDRKPLVLKLRSLLRVLRGDNFDC